MMRLLLKVVIVCLLLCSGGMVAALQLGDSTPEGWQFTYASNPDDGLWRVYTLDIERNLHIPVRIDATLRSLPLLSPDERFVVWREVPQSFLLNRETGTRHQLQDSILPLAWSPDNRYLTYTDQTDDLYVLRLDADGAPIESYSLQAPENETQSFPVWSPQSDGLVFLSYNTLQSHLYRVETTAFTESSRISLDRAGYHRSMAWSPDGSQIAYLAQPVGATTLTVSLSLYTANADGTDHRLIRDDIDPRADNLVWSPDSTRIAYSINQNDGLYVIDLVTGTRSIRLDAGMSAGRVRWSPDGGQLLFLSLRNSDFYTVNVDGRFIRRLTNNDSFNVFMP